MRKLSLVVVLAAILSVQPVFADSKPCGTIAAACIKAGYNKERTENKNVWKNCMKPVIMGEKVEGVTIDADVVKSCRTDKIAKMKHELAQFEKVSSH